MDIRTIRFVLRHVFASLGVASIILATASGGAVIDDAKAEAAKDAEAKEEAKLLNKKEEVRNPAVEAILANKPATPAELIRSAKILADLKRADLAKPMLKKALEANLSPEDLIRLGEEIGSPTLIAVAANGELRPEGANIAEAVFSAMRARLRDPQYVDSLIEKTCDPSPEVRARAAHTLSQEPGLAVSALLRAMKNADAKKLLLLSEAFRVIGKSATGPLVAALQGGDEETKLAAVEMFGRCGDRAADVFLLGPVASSKSSPALKKAAVEALERLGGATPTPQQAAQTLVESAQLYFGGKMKIAGEVNGKVMVWRWDADKREAVGEEKDAEDGARILAARFAADAIEAAPQNSFIRQLYWATLLESLAYAQGLEKPLDFEALKKASSQGEPDAAALVAAMDLALKSKRPAAARLCADGLAEIGKAEEVLYPTKGESVLVRGVRDDDRRVRLASAKAIIALKPEKAYPGSSELLPALGYFISTSGERRCLLAGPNATEMQRWATLLSSLGYHAEIAFNGQEAAKLLLATPDHEFAMIDMGISRPTAELLAQQLRHDNRAADLRIGFVAREGYFDQADRAAANDPLSRSFARAQDEQGFRFQLERLQSLRLREFVGFEERQREADAAVAALLELSQTGTKIYEWAPIQKSVLSALLSPVMLGKALPLAVRFNSPEMQTSLLKLVNRANLSPEMRESALAAFQRHVRTHGILLTSEEIRRQYDVYNRSEKLDKATQKLLGDSLDCLEGKTAEKK